jgi:predicted naringenin-chalcone synthase
VLREVMASSRPAADDWAVMLALGPGFAAEGALLRW